MKRTLKLALTAALLAGSVASAAPQATMSGTVVSLNRSTGMLVIKLDSGTEKTAHLVPTCKYMNGERSAGSAAFPVGRKIMIRLCSAINANPLQVDLVSDWFSSGQYVAKAAPAPYNTAMGDFATTNGVGGAPQGNLGVGRPQTTIGILGNGGKIEQKIDGMPENQGARMAAAQQMMTQGGMDGTGIMNPDEPTTGGPGSGTGVPVNMQCQVVRCDPASRVLQVCSLGSQQPQNVMISPSVQLPMLSAGSVVTIIGQTNPQGGYIEATNIIPVNSGQAPAPR